MGHNYDLAIIGAGSAGYAAARTASSSGLHTALIEAAPQLGGLCILRGCMPSKSLIESANRILTIQSAHKFGIHCSPPQPILSQIIARKRRLIAEFASYRQNQLHNGPFHLIRGHASFLDPFTLSIQPLNQSPPTILSARSFIIATGSRQSIPPIPGLSNSGALTSDDILDTEQLPKSIIFLGAGPVSLEMAHYTAALGVNVTILQRSPQILKTLDLDVTSVLEEAFLKRGIKIFKNTKILSISHTPNNQKIVRFTQNGSTFELAAEAVFNGLGRTPATQNLGLEKIGVTLNNNSIKTSLTQQTSLPHIFAAGDACGPHEVVHIAINQAEIAARNAHRILNNSQPLEQFDPRLFLFAIFTEPQIAVAGLTEHQARSHGLNTVSASYPFNDHGKSLIMDETFGFVKLIADRNSREILGAATVGPHASELIHEIIVAIALRATTTQLAKIPHYHPTLSEIWTYPAEELSTP